MNTPPKNRASGPKTNTLMIIFADVSLKDIFLLKEKYPWPKPEVCSRCHSVRVWKHGFVFAYFDGYSKGLFIRRFRCDDCRCVMRMKPSGYFPKFQATIETIQTSIKHKIYQGHWIKGVSRTRQQHWFRALKRKAQAYFGNRLKNLITVFEKLVSSGIIPVSRSFGTG